MRSNSGPAKRASQGATATWRRARPHATATRRSASAFAPRAAQGHHRPRLAPPHAPHPEAPRSPPGASCAAPRRTGPGLAADRRFVGGTPPYAHWPRPPCYGGISHHHRNVTGGVAPIKTEPHPPRASTTAPPCPPLPVAGELASPPFSSAPNLPSLLPRSPRSLRRHPLLGITHPPPEPQPAAGTAAGRRRAPQLELSPLEPGSPPRPRWACGRALPPPRPRARPARRNSAGATASHGRGTQLRGPESLQGPGAKVHLL
jgi:hypothetical protein